MQFVFRHFGRYLARAKVLTFAHIRTFLLTSPRPERPLADNLSNKLAAGTIPEAVLACRKELA
jgi:hypothetical protein